MLGAIGAFGVLTFGAYAQTVFNPRLVEEATFVVGSVALVLPVLALFAGWADTLRRGRPRLSSAFILGEVSLLVLLGAAAAAAAYAIEPFNLTNTQWGVGVGKLALSAAIVAVGAAVFYWGGKIWGYRVAEPLGKLVALVFLGGAVLYGGADLVSGAIGQLPAPPNGNPAVVEDGAEAMSLLSAIGAGLLLIGIVLVILAALPAALRRGRSRGGRPLGRPHPRVGGALTPALRQLRRADPRGRLADAAARPHSG